MNNPVCPKTGAPMYRNKRPLTLTYKGQSTTMEMPGWYCDDSDESIHVGDDLKVSDRALNRLKARCEGLLSPEEIRRITTSTGCSILSNDDQELRRKLGHDAFVGVVKGDSGC